MKSITKAIKNLDWEFQRAPRPIQFLATILVPFILFITIYFSGLLVDDPSLFLGLLVVTFGVNLLLGAYFSVILTKSKPNVSIILATIAIVVIGILVLCYSAVVIAIEEVGLTPNNDVAQLLGFPAGYENDLWFTLGPLDVNFSILRLGIVLVLISGGVLAVLRTSVSLLRKAANRT
ncbi:MAG: hypothetical protein ACE5OZ_19705 [Candidatus Heimdallarchaeota archaeon]